MDKAKFYDAIRRSPQINLTRQNVAGMDRVLDYLEEVQPNLQQAAYEIATSWWETGATMHPIKEFGSEKYLRSKKYWPHVGRGLVQTTWPDNYRAAAKLLGLPEETFINNPDLLMKWEYALPLLHEALEAGLYTGKSLDDYIDEEDEPDDEELREFTNARRTVNGTDRDVKIGKLALVFERGLKAGKFRGGQKPVVVPVPPLPPKKEEEKAPTSEKGPLALFIGAVLAALVGILSQCNGG